MQELSRDWGELAFRGVVALLYGFVAFFLPGVTLMSLVLLFGAFVFVDGVSLLVSVVRGRRECHPYKGLLILQGVAGIVAGVMTFIWPGMAALTLLGFMAAWAIVTGIVEIVAAVRLRREIDNEWLLGLSGLSSVLLGVAFILMPGAGLIAWVWMLGIYASVSGVLLLTLAFRVRSLSHPRGTKKAFAT